MLCMQRLSMKRLLMGCRLISLCINIYKLLLSLASVHGSSFVRQLPLNYYRYSVQCPS